MSLHVVAAKAYAVGKTLYLAFLLIVAMLKNSLLTALRLSCERKSGNQLHKGRSGGPLLGPSWQIMFHIYLYTFLIPLLTSAVNAVQVMGLWLLIHLKEYSSLT